jgi:hypothetical protein
MRKVASFCTNALRLDGLDAAEQAQLFMTCGRAYYYLGNTNEAPLRLDKGLTGQPVGHMAQALVNREWLNYNLKATLIFLLTLRPHS